MGDVILRDYQQRLVDDVQSAFREHRRVMAWLPTGSGKTEIAVHLAQREAEAGGRTLFVVDRKTLAFQGRARFQKYGIRTGIIRGDATEYRGSETVVVASVQSLRARADKARVVELLMRTMLVIIDEAHIRFAHHSELDSQCRRARILGLSATPLRDGLGEHFDHMVRGPSYAELIDAGHLVRPRYFVPHLGSLEAALRDVPVASTGDYTTDALSALMRERAIVGDAVSTWQKRAAGRPTIVFGVDIAHSKALCDEFASAGLAAEHIDQRTPDEDRAAMFARFREGRTRVLCSVNVLALGFALMCRQRPAPCSRGRRSASRCTSSRRAGCCVQRRTRPTP